MRIHLHMRVHTGMLLLGERYSLVGGLGLALALGVPNTPPLALDAAAAAPCDPPLALVAAPPPNACAPLAAAPAPRPGARALALAVAGADAVVGVAPNENPPVVAAPRGVAGAPNMRRARVPERAPRAERRASTSDADAFGLDWIRFDDSM